jgi:hypothetical protein
VDDEKDGRIRGLVREGVRLSIDNDESIINWQV